MIQCKTKCWKNLQSWCKLTWQTCQGNRSLCQHHVEIILEIFQSVIWVCAHGSGKCNCVLMSPIQFVPGSFCGQIEVTEVAASKTTLLITHSHVCIEFIMMYLISFLRNKLSIMETVFLVSLNVITYWFCECFCRTLGNK